MTNLTIAIEQFTHLNRAPVPVWTEATKYKAPHKSILLLAVLDLVHRVVMPPAYYRTTSQNTPQHTMQI
jgi:putative restriction endonuclease